MMWCMKRTNIYLAEGQAAALDRVAQAAGVSRAELIRELTWRAATLMRDYPPVPCRDRSGDCLIAATALTEGLELATLNIRHYPMFDGLARPFPT